jgi:hypothetical protein
VNDILLMESMTSKTFNISREMVPCTEMPSMIQHTGVWPRKRTLTSSLTPIYLFLFQFLLCILTTWTRTL